MYIDQIDPYAERWSSQRWEGHANWKRARKDLRMYGEARYLCVCVHKQDLSRVSQCLHFHRMQWCHITSFVVTSCFTAQQRMKPESIIVINFVSFWFLGVFWECFSFPPSFFFVLFIFVGRRLHLKWPCILKVLATGDDNHWNVT